MVKNVVKEKNILKKIINYYFKVNILMEKNGMEKDTIKNNNVIYELNNGKGFIKEYI